MRGMLAAARDWLGSVVGETARRKVGNAAFGGREQYALRKAPRGQIAAVLARVPQGYQCQSGGSSLLPHAQVHATPASARCRVSCPVPQLISKHRGARAERGVRHNGVGNLGRITLASGVKQ